MTSSNKETRLIKYEPLEKNKETRLIKYEPFEKNKETRLIKYEPFEKNRSNLIQKMLNKEIYTKDLFEHEKKLLINGYTCFHIIPRDPHMCITCDMCGGFFSQNKIYNFKQKNFKMILERIDKAVEYSAKERKKGYLTPTFAGL